MITLNFNPFPVLESERLHYRRLNESDLDIILKLRGNPESMKYIPRPLCKNLEDAKAHLDMINQKINANEAINWAVVLKTTQEVIGFVGHYRIQIENARSEIGYMITPEHYNMGYTTEIVNTLLDYGFNTLNLHSIEAVIDPKNTASERVLQKNNFVKEAHLIENEFFDGKYLDTVIYSLLKRNYTK